MKNGFNVGETVRSKYRRRWYGTIVLIERQGTLAHVRQDYDRRGYKMRKPCVRTLDIHWLERVSPKSFPFVQIPETP